MTREEHNRFWVRSPSGDVIGRFPKRRLALDRGRREAKKSGHEIEIFDSLAQIAAVETWIVRPSGFVQAAELRTIESERRDLQSGVER